MTYDPSVPSTGAKINAEYLQLQANFTQLNALYALDHYGFDASVTPANRGHHRIIQALRQAGAPAQTADTGKIYTLTNISPEATTRTDAYYAFDNATLGSGLFAPLVPFKSFGYIDVQGGDGAKTILRGFNIATADLVTDANGTSKRLTITFANKLTDAAVGTSTPMIILATSQTSTGTAINANAVSFDSHTNSSIRLVYRNGFDGNPVGICFGVITL